MTSMPRPEKPRTLSRLEALPRIKMSISLPRIEKNNTVEDNIINDVKNLVNFKKKTKQLIIK